MERSSDAQEQVNSNKDDVFGGNNNNSPSKSSVLYGPPEGALADSYVGNYTLFGTIGQGAFAKVKVAVDKRTNVRVAVKIMDKDEIRAQEFTEQVKREIYTMRQLQHRHIVRMHEVMRSETKLYIVMEYVNGGELFDKISQLGRLRESEARKYFHQLVDGVHFCHKKGVAHRDLKPENVLLDANTGQLKITDFGFSSMVGIDVNTGLLYTQCGTPEYCAPEIIDSKQAVKGYSGAKVDAWSCGIILYAMLCGRLPFQAKDTDRLFEYILECDIIYPTMLPKEARLLLENLLTRDPEKRYDLHKVKRDPWFLVDYNGDDANLIKNPPFYRKKKEKSHPNIPANTTPSSSRSPTPTPLDKHPPSHVSVHNNNSTNRNVPLQPHVPTDISSPSSKPGTTTNNTPITTESPASSANSNSTDNNTSSTRFPTYTPKQVTSRKPSPAISALPMPSMLQHQTPTTTPPPPSSSSSNTRRQNAPSNSNSRRQSYETSQRGNETLRTSHQPSFDTPTRTHNRKKSESNTNTSSEDPYMNLLPSFPTTLPSTVVDAASPPYSEKERDQIISNISYQEQHNQASLLKYNDDTNSEPEEHDKRPIPKLAPLSNPRELARQTRAGDAAKHSRMNTNFARNFHTPSDGPISAPEIEPMSAPYPPISSVPMSSAAHSPAPVSYPYGGFSEAYPNNSYRRYGVEDSDMNKVDQHAEEKKATHQNRRRGKTSKNLNGLSRDNSLKNLQDIISDNKFYAEAQSYQQQQQQQIHHYNYNQQQQQHYDPQQQKHQHQHQQQNQRQHTHQEQMYSTNFGIRANAREAMAGRLWGLMNGLRGTSSPASINVSRKLRTEYNSIVRDVESMKNVEDVAQVLKSFLTYFEANGLSDGPTTIQTSQSVDDNLTTNSYTPSATTYSKGSSPYRTKRTAGTTSGAYRHDSGTEEDGFSIGNVRKRYSRQQRNFSDLTSATNRSTLSNDEPIAQPQSLDANNRKLQQQQYLQQQRPERTWRDDLHEDEGGTQYSNNNGRYSHAPDEDPSYKNNRRRNVTRGTNEYIQRDTDYSGTHIRHSGRKGGGASPKETKKQTQPRRQETLPAEYIPGLVNEPTSLPSRVQRRHNKSSRR